MTGKLSLRRAVFMALFSASSVSLAGGRVIQPPKPFVPEFDVENPTQVYWVCKYSEPRNDQVLHLICDSGMSDPVLIPIWNYDYGDGMVEQLMHAALCYRLKIPCTATLERGLGVGPGTNGA